MFFRSDVEKAVRLESEGYYYLNEVPSEFDVDVIGPILRSEATRDAMKNEFDLLGNKFFVYVYFSISLEH